MLVWDEVEDLERVLLTKPFLRCFKLVLVILFKLTPIEF